MVLTLACNLKWKKGSRRPTLLWHPTPISSTMGRSLESRNFRKFNTEVHIWYYPNVHNSWGTKKWGANSTFGRWGKYKSKAGTHPRNKNSQQPLASSYLPCLGREKRWCDSWKSLPDYLVSSRNPKYTY